MKKDYKNHSYVGLDIGTDSVGYAVTDEKYNLLKFHGSDAWGSTIFDAASLKQERSSFRSVRRRLERKKQRIRFLQEIFAKEIAKVDERFFIRMEGSYLWRDDTIDKFTLFEDEEYTDIQYHAEYPTIHHLIVELINNGEKHDIRMLYLACAWLIGHRGHFFSNISEKNIADVRDIKNVYKEFEDYLQANGYEQVWQNIDFEKLGDVLKEKLGVTAKRNKLIEVLLQGRKPNKEIREEFPFNEDIILKLLAGSTCKLKDLYAKDEYEEFASVSLGMEEEKFLEVAGNIGDDFELLRILRNIYDWSLLADTLGDASCISEAKVRIYEQHKKDLKVLKYFIKKYHAEKYNDIFRNNKQGNYVSYTCHVNEQDANVKKAGIEEFSKYILKFVNEITPDEGDESSYIEMKKRLELRTFLPKQKNTDNRIIPFQLYLYELNRILDNAVRYFDFLNERDADNITNREKIVAIFKYKLPYFVGPLNKNSSFSWVVRTNEKITPWNYNKVIDFDASEQAFIKRMTNQCTYYPGENVLPKDSLCYHKFMVLNEINNIRIDGTKIPVEVKQEIYCELFQRKKKVKRKDITNYLICNNYLHKDRMDTVGGIDIEIKSDLSTYHAFRRMMQAELLSEDDVEKVIERASYAEDKTRVIQWLKKNYPHLSEEDMKYIANIKIKDFGRLSRKFLTEFEGVSKETGEVATILETMWNTNDNLMEILSDKYTFRENLEEVRQDYYSNQERTLEKRLDDMYISNAVRRPIYRTLDIMRDVTKAFGTPKKIFIEMTRGAEPGKKGKRTNSRKQQILALYQKCKEEDVAELKHQLESMGERVDSKLQGDKLFLYFMQFGRSAYSGKSIRLESLLSGSKEYDIDHIYPQSYVKDDSIINNKVLVYSEENGAKKDVYPIEKTIRDQMAGIWKHWKTIAAISDEKYKRLVRTTGFTEDEKYGFINRQLTETSQSTKAIAELLKEKYPQSEIVYTKAKLTSDFRQEFELYKSRSYNDLHHAVDAYLNIVVGNVYNMKFSKQWFRIDKSYSVKTKTLFTHPLICGDEVVWDGKEMLKKAIVTANKNTAHFTKYSYFKKGGLFDQMPVKKKEGLIPRKKGLDTEKYGGYNKAGVMFFIPVRYKLGKKTELFVMSVELMYGNRFLNDEMFATTYTYERLHNLLGKRVEIVEFPLGLRPWKVNTMLSLDGFRVCITGSSSGGKCIVAQPVVQFATNRFWKYYIKKLERFVEKITDNENYIYDVEYDKVCKEKNQELYNLYIEKLSHTIYQKRVNAPTEILIKGSEKFSALDIKEQCKVLMNIQMVFSRMTSGCDLRLIGASCIL